jgi:hypothetical protein
MKGCYPALDLLLLFLRQGLEMCDVQVGIFKRLLGTSLPNVGAEHLTARSEDDMSCGVVVPEDASAITIDVSINGFANVFCSFLD